MAAAVARYWGLAVGYMTSGKCEACGYRTGRVLLGFGFLGPGATVPATCTTCRAVVRADRKTLNCVECDSEAELLGRQSVRDAPEGLRFEGRLLTEGPHQCPACRQEALRFNVKNPILFD